ncbi:MAG: DUF2288 domain-containing protein [Spongiibacteraceae bacterium]|nr:DUF2288 domain-containing protein [Spongiibacteraceae bacterium]
MPEIDQRAYSVQEPENRAELKSELNRQTSKITWEELQRFYASGSVIGVAKGLDLIDVACEFSLDNKAVVEQWLKEGCVYRVEDQQAAQWCEQKTAHWAVVVAPWVLIQEVLVKDCE